MTKEDDRYNNKREDCMIKKEDMFDFKWIKSIIIIIIISIVNIYCLYLLFFFISSSSYNCSQIITHTP